MMYAAKSEDEKLALVVETDPDPLNPRRDWDGNIGTMVCWHRRYDLGDKHEYDTPEEFLKDILQKNINDGGKRVIEYIKKGCSKYAALRYNRKSREYDLFKICRDGSELVQSAPKSQLRDDGWFFDYIMDTISINDTKNLIAQYGTVFILPLFLYDHSGLAMSTGSFIGRAVHAEWDSGQVGFIYATEESAEKQFGRKATKEEILADLEGEVKNYDDYLQDNCWGYRVFRDGIEEDSCWGFLGDAQELIKELKDYVPKEFEQLVDKLEPYWGCVSAETYAAS